MVDLPPDIEAQLAGLSDADWHNLGARLRAPDTREQLRTEAAKILGDGDRATAFSEVMRLDAFTNDSGEIDPAKVQRAVTGIFGPSAPTSFGQHSGNIAGQLPGDSGRTEAAKRFGGDHKPSPIGQPSARGSAGATEAARRFGNPTTKENQ
jgi:hypothetical protein